MSETKFTKGPWGAQWSKYRDGEFIVQAGHPTCRVLARFDGDGVSDVPDEQSIANAHLIAAAPDLYVAIAAAIECGIVPTSTAKDGGPCAQSEQVRVADMLRDALAKARGEG